jgi:radical SAM superfamily enzyme YgiQ (UPF0313 family)
MITSRGCPFGCTFCSCTAFSGRRIRARSPDKVVDEMEYLVRERGAEHIWVVDDNFTCLPKRVKRICQLIKERGLEFSWFAEGRVDTASREMYEDMADAGCWLMFLGLESGSQRLLDYHRKRTTVEKGRRAVELAQRAGIDVIGSFIVGAPVETEEDFEQTLEFLTHVDMDMISISSLKVLPGTEIWREYEASGIIGPGDWDKYFRIYDLPVGHSEEEVRRRMKLAERRFCRRPSYIIRQLGRTLMRRRRLVSYGLANYLQSRDA